MHIMTHEYACHGAIRGATSFDTAPIWIDLDNSPHVPFFDPIIAGLKAKNYPVWLTARDAYQVLELARLHDLPCQTVGKHDGQNLWMKGIGLVRRSLQMLPKALAVKPRLAVSHGSRAQLMVARLLGIPSVLIADYEYVVHVAQPDVWVMPDVLADADLPRNPTQRLTYPGIKEYVYAWGFIPDADFLKNYPVATADIVVSLRPPATEAHYHDLRGERLFEDVMDTLLLNPDVRIFVLPRNQRQRREILSRWSNALLSGKVIIPHTAISGLNLIWHSDLVISGGGTMNREAAALGVPVYSIFKGKPGAVDRYLADTGQLYFIDDMDGFMRTVKLEKRRHEQRDFTAHNPTLECLLDIVTKLAEKGI